jgi:tRNA(Ile)-lysidine synthase
MNLQQQFEAYVSHHQLFQKQHHLLIAVSGGADSVVLCELCHRAGFNFTIAHCNFHLRNEESDRDEAFVKQLGLYYHVEVLVKHFDTMTIAAREKKSIETIARELRYGWFSELLQKHNPVLHWLLTAHHAQDNIETVMMNFFRGTGIAGMHGILPKNGQIIRPLLFAKKQDILEFANAHALRYETDSTNAQNDFTRNFFRNQLLPNLQQVFPEVEKNILYNIQRFTEAELLYHQAVELHKKKLMLIKGDEVHLPVLLLQKTKPLHTILYEILKPFSFSSHQTKEALQLLESETGKFVLSATHRLLKNRNWLIIAPLANPAMQPVVIQSGDEILHTPIGTLQILHKKMVDTTLVPQPETAQLDAAEISFPLLLRKWKTGDYFYPLGMGKKKKISRFLIDCKIPLHQKENVWVLEAGKKIVWVVNHRIDNRFKLKATTEQVLQITLKG